MNPEVLKIIATYLPVAIASLSNGIELAQKIATILNTAAAGQSVTPEQLATLAAASNQLRDEVLAKLDAAAGQTG